MQENSESIDIAQMEGLQNLEAYRITLMKKASSKSPLKEPLLRLPGQSIDEIASDGQRVKIEETIRPGND
jgi:hypothetical protein